MSRNWQGLTHGQWPALYLISERVALNQLKDQRVSLAAALQP